MASAVELGKQDEVDAGGIEETEPSQQEIDCRADPKNLSLAQVGKCMVVT